MCRASVAGPPTLTLRHVLPPSLVDEKNASPDATIRDLFACVGVFFQHCFRVMMSWRAIVVVSPACVPAYIPSGKSISRKVRVDATSN